MVYESRLTFGVKAWELESGSLKADAIQDRFCKDVLRIPGMEQIGLPY